MLQLLLNRSDIFRVLIENIKNKAVYKAYSYYSPSEISYVMILLI